MALGIHVLDAAWFLAGCPRPLTVSAHTGGYFFDPPASVEDTGIAFLRFEGGLALHMEVAWAMNIASDLPTPAGWTGLELMNTVLHGDRAVVQTHPAMLYAPDPRDQKHLLAEPLEGAEEADETPQAGNFYHQMNDFVRAVRQGVPPLNSLDQAVWLMRMLEAIYRSGETGREVAFDPS